MKKLRYITILPYEEVEFKWVSSHYDFHLEGTCIYRNNLCRFATEVVEVVEGLEIVGLLKVKIYPLNLIEKFKWRWRQMAFEQCIGYHWTYPLNREYTPKKPKWFFNLVFNAYYFIVSKIEK